MKIRRTKNFRNLEHALLIPPNWRGKLIKAFLQWKFRICFIRMKLGINNHTTVKGKRIVKICQVEIIKKIRKIWKKANIVGTTISFFFFCFFALRETEVEKSGKKNLWRIQNRRIPWTGYPRSLFNRLLIVIRRASHRSAFVHIKPGGDPAERSRLTLTKKTPEVLHVIHSSSPKTSRHEP